MEEKKQKQTSVRSIKEDSLLGRVLYGYYDWLISTQAKCDCEWSRCLKKIFNDHNKKEIITLRNYLYIQSHLPMKERNPFDPDLQFLVGVAYLCGWLPCKDNVEEARCWFQRSGDLGSPRGMMAEGYLHEKHLGKYHDEIAMFSLYSRAAFEGYAPAQYRLALYYQKQSNPDREQIKDLLTDAAAQEHTPAKYLLAELYPETVYNMEYREIYGYEWAELARKQKESSTGLYAPKEEQDDDNNLADLMKETHDNVKRILPIVPVVIDNNEILRRVEISVQMLQSSLNSMWTELRQDNAKAAEKWKQLMDRDLQKAASPQWASDTYHAKEDAEAFMSVLFKGDWREPGRLCDASCDALVTAYVLMKMADKLALSNYSGIVITAVWALEHECRRRFYDAFYSYLASIGVEEQDRKARMSLDGKHFTLGSVGSVTRSPYYNDFSKTTNLLSPAAQAVRKKRGFTEAQMIYLYGFPGTWDPVGGKEKTFKNMVMDLTYQYRNPAAHAKRVMTSEDAARCCDLLGITEAHKKQAELAEANKKMDNITGALKALLWLTAPLEQKE